MNCFSKQKLVFPPWLCHTQTTCPQGSLLVFQYGGVSPDAILKPWSPWKIALSRSSAITRKRTFLSSFTAAVYLVGPSDPSSISTALSPPEAPEAWCVGSPEGCVGTLLPSNRIKEMTIKPSTIKLTTISIQTIDVDAAWFCNAYLTFTKEKCKVNSTMVSAVFSNGTFLYESLKGL